MLQMCGEVVSFLSYCSFSKGPTATFLQEWVCILFQLIPQAANHLGHLHHLWWSGPRPCRLQMYVRVELQCCFYISHSHVCMGRFARWWSQLWRWQRCLVCVAPRLWAAALAKSAGYIGMGSLTLSPWMPWSSPRQTGELSTLLWLGLDVPYSLTYKLRNLGNSRK